MSTFDNKVVIVTSGSSGIGRAAALSFARQNARVIITGRRAHIAKAFDTWGRLDVLVNNASAGAFLPLSNAIAEQITKIFAVNVVGPSLLATAALPHLTTAKGAS